MPQVTQERLKEELSLRKIELEKIDTLEDKIKAELVQLADKGEQLKKNMDTFANVSVCAHHPRFLCFLRGEGTVWRTRRRALRWGHVSPLRRSKTCLLAA